jgi:hypothetical protein
MKSWLLAVFLLGTLPMMEAQTPTSNEHLQPILWMVGNWQGIEKGSSGDLKVLLSARLSPNGQVLLFHVEFEKDGKLRPKYQGMYYWHPGKNKIVLTQISEEANLAEGTYTPTGQAEADQLMQVTAATTTFELKSHYVVEKESFHFVGQFRPAGKSDWVPAVDVVYRRVNAVD